MRCRGMLFLREDDRCEEGGEGMRTTKNEDKLLEMIRQHDGDFELTNEQLSERLHLQPKSVTVLIRRMAANGKLERIYKITTSGTVRQLKVK